MNSEKTRLFGTDGIRARANRYPLDVEMAAKVGRAIANVFGKPGDTIYIGQDTRLSSDMLAMAVGAGICSAGIDVCQLGVIPTAGVAYLVKSRGAASGVVISASHNPFEDNGIKVFQANGRKATSLQENYIEKQVFQENGVALVTGRLTTLQNGTELYLQFLSSLVGIKADRFDIVIDCANGATSHLAPLLFSRIGARVKVLSADPDGRNINAGCGSEYPDKLVREVLANRASMGFAFDGDGDRLLVVDEKGRILGGDHLLAIFANHYLEQGRLRSRTVVSTVMSNLGLCEALQSMGLEHKTCQVGDRNVAEAMQECGSVLGGESSGHLILGDLHTTGDGLLASLILIEAVDAADMPLADLCNKLIRLYPQKIVNVPVASKPAIDSLPEVRSLLTRIEEKLGSGGRVLVRYSGTQSLCRVMVEAENEQMADDCARQIANCLYKAIGG